MSTLPASIADDLGVRLGSSNQSAAPALLEELRKRQPEAFTFMYERYKTQIYTYLLRLSGSTEIADDLTHDTFLSAYEALPTLRSDSSICSWLYRIASNRFRDVLRRKRIINWFSLGDRTDSITLPTDALDTDMISEQELVRTALRNIKADYAICLTLRLAEGFSTDETAQIMKTSPEAVRMRLCRARQMFKEAYRAAERGELA